jgi:predicted N-acyltransferase
MGDSEQQPVMARIAHRIADVGETLWDACAGTEDPFTSYAFLQALEESGCAVPETGWAPHHLVIEAPDQGVTGAVPMYLKNHSYGEYVFDHAWAHAYERAGGHYYPKLQVAVPFTPATGRRFLTPPGPNREKTIRHLLSGCIQVAQQMEVSSLHFTFPTEEEWNLLGEAGLLQRTGEQFHWRNEGYETFDDFLAQLASRKRKALKKERREALAGGEITIETLTGGDLREEHWDAFFHFYTDTGSRKWGTPYLNREFFSLIGERMADRIALVMASRGGRYIAGALNLIGAHTLFGRYWGCIEHHRFLHFEVCYYRAIDFAIERGLDSVEAGAQGPHKLARGYLPTRTYSAHWARDPQFHQALANYLTHERREVDSEIEYLGEHSPFRRDGDH